ncbi:hypothetical protein QOZ80_6BG0459000 [Eleusine coracana subsp. coracana]|nr:hypothetical protein QOZ80_6BG0459000 [Eleusine coracana subsp. coracana]
MLTAPLSSVTSSHLLLFAQSNMPCDQFSLFDWPVGSNSWTELQLGKTKIEQIVDFNGQFIAMDSDDRLYILHLTPRLRLQDLETICCPFMLTSCWLVACGDMLLMVGDAFSLFQNDDIGVGAYHLDMSSKPARWMKMRKLENYALFLGDDARTQPFSCINPGRWGGRSNCLFRASHNKTWTLQGQSMWSQFVIRPLFTRNNYGELQALWIYPSMFY